MEVQLIGAAVLGAVGATGALTALARRGAAPWLRARKPVEDTQANGELLDDKDSEKTKRLPAPTPGLRAVHTPNPDWKPGMKQPHPFPGTKMLELSPEKEGFHLYPFVISAFLPRPIAFISSLSKEGKGNLSPYSYFNVMSHDPPYVSIGCAHTRQRPNHMKDSEQNLLETGEFTLSMMSEWFVESANHTCGSYDRGVDELELAGLTPVASVLVKPPRVAESVVQLECKLRGTHEIKNAKGESTGRIMIGEVVLIHAAEAVLVRSPEGKLTVDLARYRPVSRLGGDSYGRVPEYYDLPRPDAIWQDKIAATAQAGHGG